MRRIVRNGISIQVLLILAVPTATAPTISVNSTGNG